MKNLSKFLLFLFFSISLFTTFYIFQTSTVSAQIPPPYINCASTDAPEFHSLRPYQSSPCNKNFKDLSYICGNDLRVKDIITVTPNDGVCQILSCPGIAICDFEIPRKFYFSVDPFESEFPIAGNTEDVANSQTSKETLDDLTKVNEYVSWYLNGVTYRAEYGDTKNTDYETVNLSGPLKKLLPSVIQEAERVKTFEEAKKTRHDQVVVCGQEGFFNILGKTKPHECYEGDGSPAKPNVYKITDWDGDLSEFRSSTNLIFGADAWNKRIPPLPWDFEEDILYKKAYYEWKGKSCVILPFVGLLCIDNPLVANKWAELFPYIPLSSTEDRLGKLIGRDAEYEDSDGVEVVGLKTEWREKIPRDPTAPLNNESALFFPHMEENVALVDQLQSTYLDKNQLNLKQVDGETTPPTIGEHCKIVDVRYNPGDQLFGEIITADVNYVAKFQCTFPVIKVPTPGGGYTCKIVGSCTRWVIFKSKIDVGTPKIDELWTKTVAGNASVVKRFFPKMGASTPLEEIKDIPGVSAIVHKTDIELLSINPEIYFPHLGGILEYFLKGIQTALRPKGYGESTSTNPPITGSCSEGSGPCSVENLLPYFNNSVDTATKASIICNKESGSNPMAKNDGCLHGGSCDYSIGLFQINLLAHCPGAFSSYSCPRGGPASCTIGNQSTLQVCEAKFLNPIENIKKAVNISSNGTNWSDAWVNAATECGID